VQSADRSGLPAVSSTSPPSSAVPVHPTRRSVSFMAFLDAAAAKDSASRSVARTRDTPRRRPSVREGDSLRQKLGIINISHELDSKNVLLSACVDTEFDQFLTMLSFHYVKPLAQHGIKLK